MSSLDTAADECSPDAKSSAGGNEAARLSGEFAKALVVAVVALVIDYSLMVALHELLGWYHLLAATTGFIAGMSANYVLSITWVFRSRSIKSRWLEFAIFAAIGVGGLGLTVAVQYLGTDVLGGPYWLSRAFACSLVFAWNFVVRKLTLFRAGAAS